MFPNFQGSLLTIDSSTIDSSNPSCLSNRTGIYSRCIYHFVHTLHFIKDNRTAWKFGNVINSSLMILAGSLQSNRTYQFMVYMKNRWNSSVQATGYVLVKVDDTRPQRIAIG